MDPIEYLKTLILAMEMKSEIGVQLSELKLLLLFMEQSKNGNTNEFTGTN